MDRPTLLTHDDFSCLKPIFDSLVPINEIHIGQGLSGLLKRSPERPTNGFDKAPLRDLPMLFIKYDQLFRRPPPLSKIDPAFGASVILKI
ncbi:MAG: hypothetical protein A2527_01100 [Candidatus Lambdaproteobacteria bacterium RIFOXYD2_FULL_50_16]|uniref:Uncharacterized protein n=1 Tax=Candidatus Lambdaproteobacteria bacterium RIFOXYD2_FULL_50_16 TaxID=1817772 RepID=A0A1F6G9L7_9PROT|nr:MAG: hypothetical protein A2527_01100 [Candidatus Lambdaproteobacteria bacterium RIFOXYD2_FULL_50_16]